MSQDLRSRTGHGPDAEPVDALDGLDVLDAPGGGRGGPSPRPGALLDWLWRFFISMRTGLWLILGLGILTLLGTLLEQAPPEVIGDPTAYGSFLDDMRPTYGGWTSVLSALGFFHIFSTWWFRGLTVLLCTSILACSVNRAPRLWKVAMHPRLHMGSTFFSHAPLHTDITLPAAPETAAAEITEVLHRHHFRVVREDTTDSIDLYADRFRFGPFGTVIAHISFVVLVLGFLATAAYGFRDEAFVVPVGTTVSVGHGTGLSVEATSFTDTYYASGQPKDYVADLVLRKDGSVVDRQEVRVNTPLRHDGVWFHQSSFGIAASMTVTDQSGKTVYAGAVPLKWQSTDGTKSIGTFVVPGSGQTVFVIMPASGQVDETIKAGQAQLEIHRAGAPQDQASLKVVTQGKPQAIDGLTYTFERTRQYTQLIVRRDPGAMLVWLGSGLLLAGLFLVFFFPHRRVWLRVRPADGDRAQLLCASTMKRDTAFEPQFHQIMTDIQLAGDADPHVDDHGDALAPSHPTT